MKTFLLLATLCCPFLVLAQDNSPGTIQGDFSFNAQTYYEDSAINASKVDEFMLMNGYANILYNKGNFTAGVRYESYMNALQGFDTDYNGHGIPYRFAQYTIHGLDITIGNFYEQFGNGLIFRSYEEKNLGIDNVMDGFRLKYSPLKGLMLKGFIAKQRLFWEHGPGIIRGIDGELNLNQALSSLENSKTMAILGGSFVSRFQEDNNPVYNLPQNVAAYAFRTSINRGKVSFNSEYAYKFNDPKGGIASNNYAPGMALTSNLSYSQRGLGILLEAHRVDNMDYRSKRGASLNDLTLNYIPAISKQHAYTLAAFYPFATQPMGELGFQGQVNYTFKKKSKIGGKYGTQVALNYSRINGLNGGHSVLTESGSHTPMFFSIQNEELFFRDFNIDLKKKLSKKVKLVANYVDLIYNKDVIEGKNNGKNIHARIGIVELNYKLKPKHTIISEVQYLSVDKDDTYYQDQGDWIMGLVEYTISPHWFFAIMDQYNGGYTSEGKTYDAVHYLNISCGYSKGTNRFELGYGKKREGIFCVGGVCREVPSSNGFTLSITSSF